MVQDVSIENLLRRLSVKQLEALSTFIPSGERKGDYMTVERAVDSIHTAAAKSKIKAAGGTISSLAKIQTDKGPLILPAGSNEKEGMRWVLNEVVISRDKLRDLLLQIPGIEL